MATALARAMDRPRSLFYAGMVSALILMVFAAFLPRYANNIAQGIELPPFVHAHAAAFTLWLFVLLAQALLIGAGRPDLHRRLGIGAAVLVVPMLALGYETAIFGARRGHAPGGTFDSLTFLILPLGDLVLFASFFATAMLWRRRPEAHKRLMLLAAIGGFAWPAITRIGGIAGQAPKMFAVLGLLLLALLLHDWLVQRRLHVANVIGVIVIAASFPLRRAIGLSDGWREIARWLTS
jgi:hypothetical protein